MTDPVTNLHPLHPSVAKYLYTSLIFMVKLYGMPDLSDMKSWAYSSQAVLTSSIPKCHQPSTLDDSKPAGKDLVSSALYIASWKSSCPPAPSESFQLVETKCYGLQKFQRIGSTVRRATVQLVELVFPREYSLYTQSVLYIARGIMPPRL